VGEAQSGRIAGRAPASRRSDLGARLERRASEQHRMPG